MPHYDTTGKNPEMRTHTLSDGRKIRTGKAMRYLLELVDDTPTIARHLAERIAPSQSLGYDVIKRAERAGLVNYVPFVGVTITNFGKEIQNAN